MTAIQRAKAIETICAVTSVEAEIIEAHQDYELGAWLDEMGFDWDGDEWVQSAEAGEFQDWQEEGGRSE